MLQILRNALGSDPRLWKLVKEQHECIQAFRLQRERDQIEYSKHLLDALDAVRTALKEDVPMDVLEEKLDLAIKDLRDTVARGREHVL